jgi:hypothetical protein
MGQEIKMGAGVARQCLKYANGDDCTRLSPATNVCEGLGQGRYKLLFSISSFPGAFCDLGIYLRYLSATITTKLI